MQPLQFIERRKIRGAIATALLLPWIVSTPVLAIAHPTNPLVKAAASAPPSSEIKSLIFNTSNTSDGMAGGFDDQGRPLRRSSGGSRGDCSDQLIALLPGTDTLTPTEEGCTSQSSALLALTLNENPTLWFHVPGREEGVTAEFVLLDEQQHAIAFQTLTLPTISGIIGIQLEHALVMDQTYRWVFSILDHTSPSQNPTVEGAIRRVDLDLAALNETPGTPAHVAKLADSEIWHDALTHLVSLRRSQPTDAAVTQDWTDFLESVGLGAIANAPLLDCCIE